MRRKLKRDVLACRRCGTPIPPSKAFWRLADGTPYCERCFEERKTIGYEDDGIKVPPAPRVKKQEDVPGQTLLLEEKA